jgi:membrane-associated protease RseP (regulator of RpoE activity)
LNRARTLLPLALFGATAASTLWAGFELSPGDPPAARLRAAALYAGTLLAVVVAHELGHLAAARLHRVQTSPPYFIPFPLGLPGMLGAFIRLPSLLPSRAAVLDIGAAGPLAGFAVALPLLLLGYSSSAAALAVTGGRPGAIFQSPASLVLALLHHQPLIDPSSSAPLLGHSLLTWLAARLTRGALPSQLMVQPGPVALGAWVGLYVTMLNLLPVGQFDGGHVCHAIFGRRAQDLGRLFSWLVLALGLFASWSWLVLFALIRALGLSHPEPLDTRPVETWRRGVALACLAVFALSFVPVAFWL